MSAPDVIDIKALYGKKYRVFLEEGINPQQSDAVYYYKVRCKYGEIYSYDGETLAGYCQNIHVAKRWAREVRAGEWPGCRVQVEGDTEVIVLFSLEQFEAVAKLLKARTRRQSGPSPEAKRKGLQRIAAMSSSAKTTPEAF